MLAVTYAGEIFTQLAIVSMLCQIWVLPFLIYMNVVDITTTNRWVVYIVITLLISKPSSHAIQAAWISRNSNGVHNRTVSAVFYSMVVQGGGMIASNIYRKGRPLAQSYYCASFHTDFCQMMPRGTSEEIGSC
jgi:hypothetical protein